jgi:NAD(P)H-flavin reductase
MTGDIFCLDFSWEGPAPKPGQFFMIKPKRSAVFLARPVSVALFNRESDTLRFFLSLRGRGTAELAAMQPGEEAELTGPLGNCWEDFLPKPAKPAKIALVSGGVGIGPLFAFVDLLLLNYQHITTHFYAGFKKGFKSAQNRDFFLAVPYMASDQLILTAEDGRLAEKGLVTDAVNPAEYQAVYACGPEPMLKTLAASCALAGIPCYISLERRMACGLGACLGCTVETRRGNKRCCADGPIFPAAEVFFDGQR